MLFFCVCKCMFVCVCVCVCIYIFCTFKRTGQNSCPKHGTEAIEWKCKFCCSVASWFCWGTTHFCDDCHRKQGTPESMSRKALKDLPQCTPATCPLKVAHPKNGTEFVLGCEICRSASSC